LMLWGYFKKLVIADRIGILVSTVFDNWNDYSGFVLIVATLFFSVQIYADFSGFIDIARGAAEVLGVHLPQNFNHPYFSKTMPEFWRRWHITLGTWFKDYVFFSVSVSGFCLKLNKLFRKRFGNRIGRAASACIPILAVWICTGIWHGAAWKYVAWGLYHGALIMLGLCFAPEISKLTNVLKIRTDCNSWRIFQMVRTFLLCTIGRTFFRADGFMAAIGILKNSLVFNPWVLTDGTFLKLGLDRPNFVLCILSIAVLLIISLMQEKFSVRKKLQEQNIVFRWLVYYVAIFSIIIFGIYGPDYNASEFIYGQF